MFVDLAEAFRTQFFVSSCFAFFAQLPFCIYQALLFVIPGLYKKESDNLIWISKIILVGLSLWISLISSLMPFVCYFFTRFEEHRPLTNVVLEPRLSSYIILLGELALLGFFASHLLGNFLFEIAKV
jgi:Sec-independent protein secretion pathway component TatC